ncbi:unnamed protein product [Trichobilharzia regenti]|nr:unnamed protein product [Trichobilharzia regenti]
MEKMMKTNLNLILMTTNMMKTLLQVDDFQIIQKEVLHLMMEKSQRNHLLMENRKINLALLHILMRIYLAVLRV